MWCTINVEKLNHGPCYQSKRERERGRRERERDHQESRNDVGHAPTSKISHIEDACLYNRWQCNTTGMRSE